MSAQGTIKRYQLILEKLRYNSYPSFREIEAFLQDEGFAISKRTLQRDIDAIRNEFDVSILFDRSRNGYYIDEKDSPGYGMLLKLIRLRNEADLLRDSIREQHNHISFEHEDEWSNIKWIPLLLEAVKHNKVVEIEHFKFTRKEPLLRSIEPYLLKEYQNRWYLVGINEDGDVRSFGLDRITKVKVTTRTFSPLKDFDAEEYYAGVIGLNNAGGITDEVILSVNPLTAEYLRSLKWHPSQEVIFESEKEVQFRFYVQINFELKQKILSQGQNIQVLAPSQLAKEIKSELKKALNNY